jgi:hypothetical protein
MYEFIMYELTMNWNLHRWCIISVGACEGCCDSRKESK